MKLIYKTLSFVVLIELIQRRKNKKTNLRKQKKAKKLPHKCPINLTLLVQFMILKLRLERGGRQWIFLSCACFLITQSFLKIYRHAIHQIKADYHSYPLVSMMLYNSSEVKLKIAKEIEN